MDFDPLRAGDIHGGHGSKYLRANHNYNHQLPAAASQIE